MSTNLATWQIKSGAFPRKVIRVPTIKKMPPSIEIHLRLLSLGPPVVPFYPFLGEGSHTSHAVDPRNACEKWRWVEAARQEVAEEKAPEHMSQVCLAMAPWLFGVPFSTAIGLVL